MRPFQSDNLDQIAPALVAAQAEMPDVPKGETVKTAKFSYSYADLASVREIAGPILARHGLAVLQTVVPMDPPILGDRVQALGALRTVLLHASGQFLAGEHPLGADWGNAQAVSSATTTARRYNLMGVCGIATVDDDGAAASRPPSKYLPRSTGDPPANGHANGHHDTPPVASGPYADFDEFDGATDHPPVDHREREYAERNGDRQANLAARKEDYNRMFSPPPAPHSPPSAPVAKGPIMDPRDLPADPSRTGRHLFGWIKEHAEWELFGFLIQRYPREVGPRIKDWDETQVDWAWKQFVRWVQAGRPALPKAEPANNGAPAR
ncbi:MAG: ERF family protein [Candidatus Limnocylindrales bacterium]